MGKKKFQLLTGFSSNLIKVMEMTGVIIRFSYCSIERAFRNMSGVLVRPNRNPRFLSSERTSRRNFDFRQGDDTRMSELKIKINKIINKIFNFLKRF